MWQEMIAYGDAMADAFLVSRERVLRIARECRWAIRAECSARLAWILTFAPTQ
jgi:hypothetical protein